MQIKYWKKAQLVTKNFNLHEEVENSILKKHRYKNLYENS